MLFNGEVYFQFFILKIGKQIMSLSTLDIWINKNRVLIYKLHEKQYCLKQSYYWYIKDSKFNWLIRV